MLDTSASHPQRPRARTAAVAAIAAGVVLAGAGTAWVIGHQGVESSTEVDGAVLVSRDGRTLTSPVEWTGCEDRPKLVAHESGTSVLLKVERVDHSQPNQACDNGQARQLATTLDSPLGSRRLVDAVDGQRIPPLRANEVATPHYLPAGYKPTDVLDPETFFGNSPTSVFDPAIWSQDYEGTTPGALVQLAQVSGRTQNQSGAPVTVNGHPGILNDVGTAITLTWFDGTDTFALFCAHSRISDSDALRIADSVHP